MSRSIPLIERSPLRGACLFMLPDRRIVRNSTKRQREEREAPPCPRAHLSARHATAEHEMKFGEDSTRERSELSGKKKRKKTHTHTHKKTVRFGAKMRKCARGAHTFSDAAERASRAATQRVLISISVSNCVRVCVRATCRRYYYSFCFSAAAAAAAAEAQWKWRSMGDFSFLTP